MGFIANHVENKSFDNACYLAGKVVLVFEA